MPKLSSGRARCNTCKADTHWEAAENGQHLVCHGCHDRFPCRSVNCGHYDCADARKLTSSGAAALANEQRAAAQGLAKELGVHMPGALKFVAVNWDRVYPWTPSMDTSSTARTRELVSMARRALAKPQ